MNSDLGQPAPHSRLGRGLHGDGAAGLDLENVLEHPDPLLQDVGRISRQVEGLLLRNQLMREQGDELELGAER